MRKTPDRGAVAMGRPSRAGAACRPSGSRIPALALVLLAGPMSCGIAAPALVLDDTAHGLGVTVAAATWIVTAFGGGVAVGTPLAGGLAARRGARAAVLMCSAVLATGVVLGAAVPILPTLIGAGALQGIGAGGLAATALSLAETPRTTGLVTASLAVIGSVSPLAGSWLAEAASWRVVYLLPAVALLAVPYVSRSGPLARDARPTAQTPADVRGALLLTVLVTGLVLIPHEAAAGSAVAAVTAVALGVHMRARPDGFVPLAVVRAPRFVAAAALAFALAVSNFGILYAAPHLLEDGWGWTANRIGLVMLWPYLAGGALSWLMVACSQRGRPAVVTGALLATGAAAPMVVSTHPPLPVLLAAMAAGSLAAASGQAILTVRAASAAPGDQLPTAVGLFNLCYLLGSAFGPAIAAASLDSG
ncbi:MFS transporter [Yinghuangia sp. YIM S10712]|uniref:MFS transporter n=1 Tax=Yinghuangia sp. YIM S10712 TaxID=3436930 RepID=UPI003F538DC4